MATANTPQREKGSQSSNRQTKTSVFEAGWPDRIPITRLLPQLPTRCGFDERHQSQHADHKQHNQESTDRIDAVQ